jgi:ubiquinone biosynthesis protein
MPVRRILVGTDRSETATRAVRWAAEMAERYEAELIVTQSVPDGMERATTERELAAYVDDVVGSNARTLVRSGDDPARQMAEIAREESVDVIVVGSVGMSGRKEFLLENIPNRVSHMAPCTVVIVQTQRDGGRR